MMFSILSMVYRYKTISYARFVYQSSVKYTKNLHFVYLEYVLEAYRNTYNLKTNLT